MKMRQNFKRPAIICLFFFLCLDAFAVWGPYPKIPEPGGPGKSEGVSRPDEKGKKEQERSNFSREDGTLPLIPYPREIRRTDQYFRIQPGTGIHVLSNEQEDLFAAEDLTGGIRQITGMELTVQNGGADIANSIVLTRPGLNEKMDRWLSGENLEIAKDFHEEGYVLLVNGSNILVAANSATGIFYGVQTLKQLIHRNSGIFRVPGVKIRDWPEMRYRWIQDDWNRGPIPKLAYAKEQVRILSEYKLNGYMIYSENLFQSELYPTVNPYGGTIKSDEMAELIAFGKKHHVEIIPQQQTFGHLHYVLRQEQLAPLGERRGSQILSPAEEGSYQFIDDYLGEIVPMFSSGFFHIGCDETFELGLGKSKGMVERSSFIDVYLDHLRRVAASPALQGKKLLFWGEIALKHPEKLDELPGNVIPVPWQYLPMDSYKTYVQPYADRNMKTIVAPSAFFGGRPFPDFSARLINIRNFVRDGQKYGAEGMLNTTWDDLGEDIFGMGWYGIIFSAAASWQEGESDLIKFRDAYDWAFYRIPEGNRVARAIEMLAAVNDTMDPVIGRVNTEMIYSNPFVEAGTALQNRIQESGKAPSMRLQCEDAYTVFKQSGKQAEIHKETIDALLLGARRMEFIFHKSILASQMSQLFDSFVRNEDISLGVNTPQYDLIMPYASRLGSLRDVTKELKMFHEDQWNKENRPFHRDLIEMRYMRLLMGWEDMYERILKDIRHAGSNEGQHLPREEVGFGFERPGPAYYK